MSIYLLVLDKYIQQTWRTLVQPSPILAPPLAVLLSAEHLPENYPPDNQLIYRDLQAVNI